ncbi:unnamed protein product [Zymoseptoria tritici ST99CH_3D7]|uniref:Uncharacterized protein n=1 Tax=Zymoseptoria tritici (strain ST99CH_3D7) TaxID=1276538 RepID=A0A1X7RFK9_ZYMT9|nr:unnamed protein product [Zymoseptoria tritici ST99CH_3D7]
MSREDMCDAIDLWTRPKPQLNIPSTRPTSYQRLPRKSNQLVTSSATATSPVRTKIFTFAEPQVPTTTNHSTGIWTELLF